MSDEARVQVVGRMFDYFSLDSKAMLASVSSCSVNGLKINDQSDLTYIGMRYMNALHVY